MFGSLGVPELLLIFFVILIVFGPRRIPEIGRTLGKALGEFRKATDDLKNTIDREVRLEELKQVMPNAMTPFESISRTEPVLEPSPGPFSEPPPESPSLQVAESPSSGPSDSSETRRPGDSETSG
jgi:TatA/E family protein of Tat protein translocase